MGHDALQSIGPWDVKLSSDPNDDDAIRAAFALLFKQTGTLGPEDVALSLANFFDQLPRNCYRTDQSLI